MTDVVYVFATKGGAPTNPNWYRNLTAAGDGSVERGTETYKVTVRESPGVNPLEAWGTPLCGLGASRLGHVSLVVDR